MRESLRWVIQAVLGLLVVCLLGGTAVAASPAAIEALRRQPDLVYSPDTLLVRFRPGVGAAVREQVRRDAGAGLRHGYGLVPGLELLQVAPGGVERALAALRRRPEVAYAEPDNVVRSQGVIPNDTHFGIQWGLHNSSDTDINAPEAWEVTTGNSAVVVAVIDSGIQWDHPDLNANTWINVAERDGGAGVDDDGNGYVDDLRGWDFFAGDNNPMDENGHGTHVAGTIGAVSNNSRGVAGVAWQVRLMPLRFLGPDGGYTSDAIKAIEYAVANGATISNNSWGGGSYSTALYDAIKKAGLKDHLFVAAAGNDGRNTDATPSYPASYDLANIVSVAAVDKILARATFSNYGANSVDLGAPGVDIVSTYPSNTYAYASGTSMAAPHVAGVAALLRGHFTSWTHTDVKDRLLRTVRPVASMDGVTVSGGVVDAAAAVSYQFLPPAAPGNLLATALSDAAIELGWSDNADNEQGFEIEASTDGATWELVGVTLANAASFIDDGLLAETAYSYRVRAFNDAGVSDYSNLATATTLAKQLVAFTVASGESAVANGGVVGSYVDTWSDDGVYQQISETLSGGSPKKRYSYLEHRWVFDNVPSGDLVTLHVQAFAPATTDNESCVFAYSLDGSTYTDAVVVTATSDDGAYQVATLSVTTSGTVYLRVRDTNRSAGKTAIDTLYVDHLFIRTELADGEPPAAPSNLTAAAAGSSRVDLLWQDNADNESCFEVERSHDGATWQRLASLPADTTGFGDLDVEGGTTYYYRVRAANAAGASSSSNTAQATTEQGIVLTASGRKVRAIAYADLSWSGAGSSQVEVYRNGAHIATVDNTGAHTDDLGKVSGTYTYQVSEPGGVSSNTASVSF
jgi:subtilisin family serine protease